jgi:hypothetical protein
MLTDRTGHSAKPCPRDTARSEVKQEHFITVPAKQEGREFAAASEVARALDFCACPIRIGAEAVTRMRLAMVRRFSQLCVTYRQGRGHARDSGLIDPSRVGGRLGARR